MDSIRKRARGKRLRGRSELLQVVEGGRLEVVFHWLREISVRSPFCRARCLVRSPDTMYPFINAHDCAESPLSEFHALGFMSGGITQAP
jgi:hypothetical protein